MGFLEIRGVRPHLHSRSNRNLAGRNLSLDSIDLHQAGPAGTRAAQVRVIAQSRGLNTLAPQDINQRLSFAGREYLSVYGDLY